VGSFKVKLVLYFLLLSLLPIAAAFWGFTSVAGQSETRRVDARLQASLRAVLATYQERIDEAQRDATSLARTPFLQRELEQRNLPALVHALQESKDVSVSAPGGFRIHRPPPFAATREVSVVTTRGLIGTVTVAVPFDSTLVETLRAHSGLSPADSLVILRGNAIASASPTVAGTVRIGSGRAQTVDVSGERFRALAAPAVYDVASVRFAVLRPQALIDAANASSRNRLLLGLIASLALVSLVAYHSPVDSA